MTVFAESTPFFVISSVDQGTGEENAGAWLGSGMSGKAVGHLSITVKKSSDGTVLVTKKLKTSEFLTGNQIIQWADAAGAAAYDEQTNKLTASAADPVDIEFEASGQFDHIELYTSIGDGKYVCVASGHGRLFAKAERWAIEG